ncbi:reverse transcriptase [Corchorus capsularis]|uniref:Reverse transcriptase n=1 Tax=Corchorus capsularis TaxID=210143 RepID=A0A1R3JQC2_COCAP|nr:reverse transcriptase [Corchorus capsularis]
MNNLLGKEFTEDEIKLAAFQMNPSKSPGPDGFNPCFYQKYWSIVGGDVTRLALEFHNEGKPLPDINHTTIVLIPKVADPSCVKEFRPISLCNVLIKIITKALTNRLKLILPQIISETQSAFVPGRQMFDNSMIAFEIIHHMSNSRSHSKQHMALKLDLRKAYDRVEWQFLEDVMRVMGFSERWISSVMTCVRTVTYSVSVNGNHSERIYPTRGIRQGDPLSPYLFLLCMEGFTSLLKTAELNGNIEGVSVARHAPKISHLFFADDILLFIRAQWSDCATLLDILNRFELASGQQINIEKSSIFFSKSTPDSLKNAIMSQLEVWRLMQSEASLCYRILKAKYFTNNSLIDANLGRNPSFLWRSLLAGRKVIIEGSRWRIGNGMTVKVWEDKWINNSTDFKPHPLPGTLCNDQLRVSDLIDHVEKRWLIDRLELLFQPDDIQRILCMPIPVSFQPDKLIWNDSSVGIFTVKSGYFVARRVLQKEEYSIADKNPFNRNKCVFEHRCCLPSALAIRAQITLQDCHFSSPIQSSNQIMCPWVPPTAGIIKLNTDAAYNLATGTAKSGTVLRNSTGQIICSGFKQTNYIVSVLHAEVLSIHFGLQMALRNNVDCIEVHADSLMAVKEIARGANSNWEGGCLITEILHLASLFSLSTFSYSHRSSNTLAHNIAQLDLGVGAIFEWYGALPPCVCNLDN